MNGFQKEYWDKQSHIAKKNWKYHKYAWLVAAVVNLLAFYTDRLEILFAKVVVLAVLIMGILEAKLNLPSFFIEENKHNKTEVRVLMILAPLVLYGLLLFDWFE